MHIADIYSLNNADKILQRDFSREFFDISSSLSEISVSNIERVVSKEQRYNDIQKFFYSPKSINNLFKEQMTKRDWEPKRIKSFNDHFDSHREVDFYEPISKIAVEIQFGKYSFMSYDIFTKMPIFHTHGLLEVGIEIVPVYALRQNMCSGIGFFEQLVSDIESMGPHIHDIPVLILGVDV